MTTQTQPEQKQIPVKIQLNRGEGKVEILRGTVYAESTTHYLVGFDPMKHDKEWFAKNSKYVNCFV